MNDPITMPQRYRVWDKKNKEMYSDRSMLETVKLVKMIGDGNAVISQDTGFRDRNGVTEYTGDVVLNLGEYLLVCYEDGVIKFRQDSSSVFPACSVETEVIGNIWQNPELLEVTNG